RSFEPPPGFKPVQILVGSEHRDRHIAVNWPGFFPLPGPQKETNKEMRKRLTWTLALGAVLALVVGGVAMAAKPTVVRVGNLVITFNGGFSPTKLSKTKPTPISLNIQGNIKTTDGSHPPALTSFVLETDKAGGINAKGVPTCKQGQLEATTTATA